MTGLSQEDRELIRQAINDIPLRHLGWAANAETIRDELAPTIDDLITRHVREALNAAAEEVGFWEANAQRVTTSDADAETVRNSQARQSAYRRAGAIIRAHASAP